MPAVTSVCYVCGRPFSPTSTQPTKENCRKAIEALEGLQASDKVVEYLHAFLDAAQRQLPTQASYIKSKYRRERAIKKRKGL